MQVYKYLIAFCATVALITACEPEVSFPVEPQISELSFVSFADSTGELTFNFTDGDGNIGLNLMEDTLPPFDSLGNFYFNLRILYEELQNGTWVSMGNNGFSQRVPPFANNGQALEGIMRVTLSVPTYYNPNTPNDTLRYQVTLIDRDLNLSNTLISDPILKP